MSAHIHDYVQDFLFRHTTDCYTFSRLVDRVSETILMLQMLPVQIIFKCLRMNKTNGCRIFKNSLFDLSFPIDGDRCQTQLIRHTSMKTSADE